MRIYVFCELANNHLSLGEHLGLCADKRLYDLLRKVLRHFVDKANEVLLKVRKVHLNHELIHFVRNRRNVRQIRVRLRLELLDAVVLLSHKLLKVLLEQLRLERIVRFFDGLKQLHDITCDEVPTDVHVVTVSDLLFDELCHQLDAPVHVLETLFDLLNCAGGLLDNIERRAAPEPGHFCILD